MDTLQLIKINNHQLLAVLASNQFNISSTLTIDLKIEDLNNFVYSFNQDILNQYSKSGPSKQRLDSLAQQSNDLFNILNLSDFSNFFQKIKKQKSPYYIQLIVDSETNIIPFEILHDGHDFLSDYIIFSRSFLDLKERFNDEYLIQSNKKFTLVGNPSDSDDIGSDVNIELDSVSSIINPFFNLRGPYKGKHINKIELIRLLGSTSLFHFSGHYIEKNGNVGWQLNDDIFGCGDINKISDAPDFLFSNSCGDSSLFFSEFIKSFLNKGTKSVVCTLANLPSNRAKEFSDIFYNFFVIKGYNIGKSLFLTRKSIIKKYGYEDLVWCFYQLYGSSLIRTKTKSNIISRSIQHNSKIKYLLFSFFIFLTLYFTTIEEGEWLHKRDKAIWVRSNIDNDKFKTIRYFPLESNEKKLAKLMNDNIIIDSLVSGTILKFEPNEPKYEEITIPFEKGIFCNSDHNHEFLDSFIDCEVQEIFIDVNNKKHNLFSYDSSNSILNIFFHKKVNYETIYFSFQSSKELKLYMKKDSDGQSLFYLFDDYQNKRYKIPLSTLIGKSNFTAITFNQLVPYSDTYYQYQPSANDLFSEPIEFDKSLIIHINKKAPFYQ